MNTFQPILGGLGGALGGALGTAALQQSVRLTSHLPERAMPTGLRGDPSEFLVRRGEKLAHHALPPRAHEFASKGLPWMFGIAGGAFMGLLAPRFEAFRVERALIAGVALGTVVWATGYLGWLPAVGLAPAVSEEPPGRVATGWLTHVMYGVLAVVPVFVALAWNEQRRPAHRWARRFALLAQQF